MRALALLYHDVVPADNYAASGFSMPGADHYKLTVEAFDQHLAAIAAAAPQGPVRATDDDWEQSFLFTIDDGGASAMHIAERLETRGWRAHFFITTNYIRTRGFLTENQIRELSQRGHVIGSHSCSHPAPMWSCSDEQIFSEWNGSCRKLEDILGEPVITASVPAGFYVPKIARAAAQAGVRILFNSEPTRSVGEVEGCRVLGRYGVTQITPAVVAARLAQGDAAACFQQWAFWNTKKLAKKLAGRPYAAMRAKLMERG